MRLTVGNGAGCPGPDTPGPRASRFKDLAPAVSAPGHLPSGALGSTPKRPRQREYQAKAPGNRAWLTALYRDVLKRAPDAAGLSNFERTLTARPAAKADIARAFLRSPERHTLWTNAVYAASAGRAPTPTERAAGVNALNGGLALEELPVRVLTATAP